ncbi:transporter substrate-binding domain-containing protein [Shewanella sp. NFH-SH190041]|uniref:transporter substrate-binding domain-containing protein n=1 Tax=Shewanella sp. NFH-SH190041 TaxID=2950245 RepID=UPI0021C4A078|nr:transporter substrate-binding domain-containing protein [Shewanella sp. NFH-SH190041]
MPQTQARDLPDIMADGVLRHIGVPYANFVTQYQENGHIIYRGLDVELIQGFARYLGLSYRFVPASWEDAVGKLTGQNTRFIDGKIIFGKHRAIEGDLMAHGLTQLPWREKIISFSHDYFPSAVWLVAKRHSNMSPISPSGDVIEDIIAVKKLMRGREVLAKRQSCLDPDLYNLQATGARIILPPQQMKLNEMVPAVLNDEAETTLLDVPDTLIALQKWPAEVKVIGPVSEQQKMAVGFRKNAPQLRQAFNQYLAEIKANSEYNKLVSKYYPGVFYYYPTYFASATSAQ